MLSQKLQNDLMSAYQKVYEEKRGHAAGASDVEKQASQLASDVRYKAKGKVKPGASDEEKKKVFLQILGASPAPNAVKAMARQKLIGEEVEVKEGMGQEMFDKNKIGGGKKIEKKQVELPKFKNTDNPDFKKPEKKVTEEMSPKEVLAKKMKEKKINKLIKKDAKQNVKTEKELASAMMGEAKVDSTKIFNVGGDRNVRRFGKEGQFDPQGSGPRGQDISQKAKLAAQRTKEHEARRGQKTGAGGYTPSGTMDEGSAYGMYKGDGMSFPERLKKKSEEKKNKKKMTEDAKMGRMSDDDLGKAHKKFSGMDQSTPSNKFMLKRIEKELKKRKKVNEGLGDSIKEVSKTVQGSSKKPEKQTKRMKTGGDGTAYMGEAKVRKVMMVLKDKRVRV